MTAIDVTEHRALLIRQYAESPRLIALIDGLLSLIQERLGDPLNALDRYMSPEEAPGAWLDYLGRRLGLPRPLIADSSVAFFGFDGNSVGFDQGPFKDAGALEVRTGIGDEWYARLLHARALFLRSGASRDDVLAALDPLFEADPQIVETNFAVTIRVAEPNEVYFEVVETAAELLIPRSAGVLLTLERT